MILGRKQGDPRVKRILDALELKYSIDSDGDFKVVLEFSDCDPNSFAQSLSIVLQVADEMEAALTGGDRL